MKIIKQFFILSLVLSICGSGCRPRMIEMPEEAKKAMHRGQDAIGNAVDSSGFTQAAVEFEKAVELAPQFSEPHYNLGRVYTALKDYGLAAEHYKKFTELAGEGAETISVRDEINRLEQLVANPGLEPALVFPIPPSMPVNIAAAGPDWNSLSGMWYVTAGATWNISIYGNTITLVPDQIWYNGAWQANRNSEYGEKFSGTINDYQISGTYTQNFSPSNERCCPSRNWNFSGFITTDMQKIYLTHGYGHCGFDGQVCGAYLYADLEKKFTRSSNG